MGDRYSILGAIAKGGMAKVYLGRMVASAGFSRLVAIKRLHDSLSEHPEFVAMLVDEARLTARIRHPNVVDVLDLVVQGGAFALVLEWVEGASIADLFKLAQRESEPIPRPIACSILLGVLRGLAAAHEARSEDGQPLGIVHRDVSPQNVLVGVDGIPRIIDFGVAKALGKLGTTRTGEVRGKYAYMAPEQLMGHPVTVQVDLYAAGVVLWELLTGARLFKADDERVLCAAVMRGNTRRPSELREDVPAALDAIVLRATSRDPSARYLDAHEMIAALEPFACATEAEVGAWVRALAADAIEAHESLIRAAATPEPPRSLETLLLELSPPSEQPLPSESLPGLAQQVPSPKKKKTKKWSVAIGAAASLGVLAVAAFAIAIAGASPAAKPPPATAAEIPPAPTSEPVVAESPAPPPEVAASDLPIASAPAASSASAPPRRPKQRHSTRAPATPAPIARDPTDYR